MMNTETENKIYGLMAEFDGPSALKAATAKSHEAGYVEKEAYSPFPIHGLSESLGFTKTKLPFAVLCGGIIGACTGFFLQYWASAVNYPLNVGGRPLNSWVSFIPIIFELTVLFSAFTAVFGMIGSNGLPMPYHPVFNNPDFVEKGSKDGFFLVIESKDPQYDTEKTKSFLESCGALKVVEVES